MIVVNKTPPPIEIVHFISGQKFKIDQKNNSICWICGRYGFIKYVGFQNCLSKRRWQKHQNCVRKFLRDENKGKKSLFWCYNKLENAKKQSE